jgi:hypothetical protein
MRLEAQHATSSAFKGIKVGQVPKSRRCSSEPHNLSAARAKRRRWRVFTRVFVRHGRKRSLNRNVAQLSDCVLGMRKCCRNIRQVHALRIILDQVQSVYREEISPARAHFGGNAPSMRQQRWQLYYSGSKVPCLIARE